LEVIFNKEIQILMSTGKTKNLTTYTSDLHALERHFMNAVKRQKTSARATDKRAVELLNELDKMASSHVQKMEAELEQMGGEVKATIKSKIASFTGSVAGMIDSVRDDALSKMLRDDYAALSMITIGYTMLHTHALSNENQKLADISKSHLEDCTILITEISKVIPLVTAYEINSDTDRAEEIGAKALENTQRAWKPGHVNSEPEIA
jgi:F0F1-type ATP synthase membrane subunit b/b'